MAQQARNLAIYFEGQGDAKPTHIVRDRDSKFTEQFCAIVENDGIEFKLIPPRSPNLNPFAERWIQSVKRECLDHFIVFGEAHLRYLIDSYVDYYHRFRPHQGLKNLRIGETAASEKVDDVTTSDRRSRGLAKAIARSTAQRRRFFERGTPFGFPKPHRRHPGNVQPTVVAIFQRPHPAT